MDLRRAEFGSDAYRACLELRRVVLREPLGLEWSGEDLAEEDRDRQFGLWDGEEVVACLSIRPLERERVKLRQMAVRADRQGQGLGAALVCGVLDLLRGEGVGEVELHARETVLGFYESLGFAAVGERFTEIGLPHRKMNRQI